MVTTLDKSKALDKFKWGFIQRVMERLGFNARWINLIMQFISSIYYSVLINDVANGNIIPTRGLHQGGQFLKLVLTLCRGLFSTRPLSGQKPTIQWHFFLKVVQRLLTSSLQTIASSIAKKTSKYVRNSKQSSKYMNRPQGKISTQKNILFAFFCPNTSKR